MGDIPIDQWNVGLSLNSWNVRSVENWIIGSLDHSSLEHWFTRSVERQQSDHWNVRTLDQWFMATQVPGMFPI